MSSRASSTPPGIGQEWCDATVLRRLRRRSLAALRHELEPVPPAALATFLPQWQHLGSNSLRGIDGLARAVEQLQGAPGPGLRPGEADPPVPGLGLRARRCWTN